MIVSRLLICAIACEIFVDGANAYRLARDYKKVVSALPADRKLTVQMAPGGGFAAIIKPVK